MKTIRFSKPYRMLLVLVLGTITSLAAEPDPALAAKLKAALQTRRAQVDPTLPVSASTTVNPQADAVAGQLRSAIRHLTTVESARTAAAAAAASVTHSQPGPNGTLHLRANGTVRQWVLPNPSANTRGNAQPAAASRPSAESVTRQFLTENGPGLQLLDPARELVLTRSHRDSKGLAHVRFEQQWQGLPVWPASLTVHLDASDRVSLIDGAYIPSPAQLDLVPTLSADNAAARAKSRLPGAWAATHTEPELIVYAPIDAAPQLGWKLDIAVGLSRAWRVVVDAHNGRVLHRSTRVMDAGVAGSGTDLTGATRTINVWQQGNTYYLADTSKAMFNAGSDPITNPRGVITVADARNTPIDKLGDDSIFNITSTSANAWTIPAGISAAFNFSQTYDYFRERHNRNSLDNSGGNITAIVQVGNYDNASWHGNLGLMLFGTVRPFVASLDVVGHELSHGVTEKTAGLIYELQSGALNEAFSDIFGEMVEARTRGANDWLLGSELAKPIRNMKNPGALIIGGLNKPFPSKMSEFLVLPNTDDADHGGVHLNSSIINRCFYLLAEGLPTAIGRGDAERIFYRTLTEHLHAQSQFIDCRLGAQASADALFGKDSAQSRATSAAFDAVEIFAAPSTPEPTPIPVVQGPDSTLFIYQGLFGFDLGRNEKAQGDPTAGSTLALSLSKQRPAITGNGSLALFVSEDNDLCAVSTADPDTRQCLGLSGVVHSAAISPDGKLAAFVLRNPNTQQPEGQITVVDLTKESNRTFNLVSPAIDGVAVDQVLYADAMSFSTDGHELLYDAVSRVKFAGAQTVERWSIYALDLTTERTEIVVPPIEGIDTGNPSPGRAGTRYLVLDAISEATGRDGIVVLDRFTGEFNIVAAVDSGPGYPSFTGDESAVIFSGPDGNIFGSGVSLFHQGLTSSRLEAQGNLSVWQDDALLGVIYRRGAFSGTNALPIVTLGTQVTGNAPATVALSATASDPDGSVVRVEFYEGATKLGEATTATAGAWKFNWTNVSAGTHRLTARAIDNLGGTQDSAQVEITVNSGTGGQAPTIDIQQLANRTMRLTVRGQPGSYIVSQSTNLKVWADVYPVTVTAAGTGFVDDVGGPANNAVLFYRARRE